MQIRIVAFSPDYYPAFTALWNQAYPDLKRTELEMRLQDMSLIPQASLSRWIAEHDGTVVGFGAYELLNQASIQGHKHQLHVFVSPEHRGKGIGTRFYEQLSAASSSTDAQSLSAWTRQDREESVRFLVTRGFTEEMRTYHSSLDCLAFDLSMLGRYLRRLEKYGYELVRFDDLARDHQRNEKTHELFCEVIQDVPSPDPPKLLTFDEFEQKLRSSPELFSAYFLALHRGQYVGLCILLPHGRARHELYADTMGIKRAYRGRGIAQALSYKGIEYAKRHNYSLISADSFVENHRINALLENLGFGNRTMWTRFSKSR